MFKKRLLKKQSETVQDKPLILLIDDEVQNLNVLEGVLKRSYEVISCLGGQQALDMLADMEGKERIKVIISDQRMPNMTGVEFFHKVKDVLPNSLRIILTGYTDVSDIIDSINKANIYKFINKPFQPPDLLVTVLRACELFDINRKLRVSEQLKQEFINTVRHELRTPMNGIQGGVELLKMSLEGAKDNDGLRVESFKVIEDSAKQMMQIVTSILDFSTFDSQSKMSKDKKRVVNLQTCFDSVIKKSASEALLKGLELQASRPNEPVWVCIDIVKWKEILIHLLSNAVKFTEVGHIDVKISCEVKSDISLVTLCVKDTGIGIDEALQNSVFDMFVQGDSSFCRQYGGLGVGLAKTKNLVEHLEGSISLQSKAGEGSAFIVTLPASISSETADERVLRREVRQGCFSGVPIVAVVEDNPINQLVLTKILERLGCRVHISNNGKEFADWSLKNEASLIFMDCQMPVKNGYEAAECARSSESLNKKTPIIACTANVSEEDKVKCYNSGMDGFIGKPISLDGVREVLATYLGYAQHQHGVGYNDE